MKTARIMGMDWSVIQTSSFARVYGAVAAVIGIMTWLYIWRKPLELWESVTLLTIAMLGLPYVSYDYRLLHVYLGLLLFIGCGQQRQSDWSIALVFGLLLIPKHYVYLIGEVSTSVILTPLLLILLAAIIIGRNRGSAEQKSPGKNILPQTVV